MNLTDPALQNLLAGEYVLGTLRGRARDRFEKYLRDSGSLRQEVAFWEQAMAPLDATDAADVPDLLPAIERRLGWQADRAGRGISGWFPALIFATVAGISLLLWAPWQPAFEPDLELALVAEETQAQWRMAVDRENNRIELSVERGHQIPSAEDLELWLLVDGGAPISLGLIPEAGGQRLSIASQVPLAQGNGLAISVEPRGGSPTGAPTGPVIAAQMFPTA